MWKAKDELSHQHHKRFFHISTNAQVKVISSRETPSTITGPAEPAGHPKPHCLAIAKSTPLIIVDSEESDHTSNKNIIIVKKEPMLKGHSPKTAKAQVTELHPIVGKVQGF